MAADWKVSTARSASVRAVRIGLADPMGAALYNYYTNGELRGEGDSITEGIGQTRITIFRSGFICR